MPPSPSRPKSRGLAERKASLTAFQRANLLRGNITREVTLPDYFVNQRETQGYSWVLKSLWKKVSGLGAFSEAGHSGDGARVNIVDTAVIEHGGKNIVKDYYTTETDGAKKGYIKRRNGATLDTIKKEFLGDLQGLGEAGSLANLPVAIVHTSTNEQQLVGIREFQNLCQAPPPNVVAISRFVPPRGSNVMEDSNLQARGTDTVVGNFFHEFTLNDSVMPQFNCYKYGSSNAVQGFAKVPASHPRRNRNATPPLTY
jgi:hypothetical protein